jgi:competence ComEA-like helix-hairpin-helix protein
MSNSISKLVRAIAPVVAIGALILAMGGTWSTTPRALAAPVTTPTTPTKPPANAPPPSTPDVTARPAKKEVMGKLNLNTATEQQLMLLPTVGPSKADRIVAWRKKNGGFKRTADLRRVKGFGYRTYKRLEPLLDIKGDTTLAVKH